MPNFRIVNNDELSDFFHRNRNNSCYSVKGIPPAGMTYSDGDLVEGDINVAWVCKETAERIDLTYGEEL
jgi:hypothetical protein